MLRIALALALGLTTMGTTYALSHTMGGKPTPAVQQAQTHAQDCCKSTKACAPFSCSTAP